MERISWEPHPKYKNRAIIVPGNSPYLVLHSAKTAAVKWCKEHGIFFWVDTLDSISFTNNDDLVFFLLRWS